MRLALPIGDTGVIKSTELLFISRYRRSETFTREPLKSDISDITPTFVDGE